MEYTPGLLEWSFACACMFLVLFEFLTYRIRIYSSNANRIFHTSDFVSRYISTIHAISLSCINLAYITGIASPDLWLFLQCIPVGYCMYSTVLIYGKTDLYIRTELMAVLYYIVSGMGVYFLCNRYPRELSMGYLSEISTPFMSTWHIMIHTRLHATYNKLFSRVAIGLFTTFLVFRMCIFAYLCYIFYNIRIITLPPIVFLFIVNSMWFFRICKRNYIKSE